MPLNKEPINKTANANDKLCENSPANVDGILPPHIELASMNKKAKENTAPRIGVGCLNFINFNEKKTAIGSNNVPSIVINLNAICNGII